MLLYNPRNGATFDTESDDDLHNAVYLEAGWLQAPDPEPAPVGRAPEPVVYGPVTPIHTDADPQQVVDALKKSERRRSKTADGEEPSTD